MAAKRKLDDTVKTFIVERLAMFDGPEAVAKAVKEEFGLEVTRQLCESYNPTKAAAHGLGKKWRAIFEATRQRFLDTVSDVPIANRTVRLRMLQRMADQAIGRGNYPLVSQLLEQAAKEVGDAYTNRQRHEVTGKDGGPIEKRDVSTYSEAELEARIKELSTKVGV